MKPKTNRRGDKNKPAAQDSCQTPSYALAPLLPYIKSEWTIWESAAGEGKLVSALPYENEVIGSDIVQGSAFNFFSYQPYKWDIQVTNPPYRLKYEWIERSYQLNKPFALLVPIETLGAQKAQEMFKKHGFEIMLLDNRVDFYMPFKGLSGKGAQFPVLWVCWNLLPEKVMFGSIKEAKRRFKEKMNAIQRHSDGTNVSGGLGQSAAACEEEAGSARETVVFDW